MRSMAGVTVLLVLVLAAVPAFATDYTVGDSQGWTSGVDYSTWLSDKTFKVGDTLLFQYGPLHSVDEVSQSDYGACSSSNTIQSYSDQSTKITLTAPGSRYFICGTPGHCSGGMKLAVSISAGSSSGSPPSTPSTPSTPSGSTTNPPSTPSTTPSEPNSKNPPSSTSTKSAATGSGFQGGKALMVGMSLVGVALVV